MQNRTDFLEQNNVARTFLSLHRKNRHGLMFEIFYL